MMSTINTMTLVPKREYVILLLGDVIVFAAALWLTLAIRYFAFPTSEQYETHLVAFFALFVIWPIVFFLAGLYAKHTRIFRQKLPAMILAAQGLNVVIAALFFFLIPLFGLAPKTILVIYLVVSSPLIFLWRVLVFGRVRSSRVEKGVLLATGDDIRALYDEVQSDEHARFKFEKMIDTATCPAHEIVQEVIRLAEQDHMTFLAVDFSDKAVSVALPMIYDATFKKKRFLLIDARELYQEVFDKVPLSLINYEWVLENLRPSRFYDTIKRATDILFAFVLGIISLVVYPFVILAIKLEDGGSIFAPMPRVGKHQQHFKILKFRSMTGNDAGNYGQSGKTQLKVTRVGKWLRLLRVDELPQLWNILKGDLSFVGPRPEVPSLALQYSSKIPYYNARHLVVPGLTGWAQIRHDLHPHHGVAFEETKEKLTYDLYYLKRRSVLLDIYIILQTIKIVLTAKGS